MVNGEEVELTEGASVGDAAEAIEIDPQRRGVAVALDGEVVPRSGLATTPLCEGSRVEVVAAIGGGR